MKKILISLKVPYLEQEFDLLIPENKKIGNIKNDIIKVINELYPGFLSLSQNLSFYERTTGELIRNDMYVKDYIKNGCHLVLI